MSKKIGVLFSSGLDSTYLVWNNLKKGNEVYPIYFEIKNNQDKPILEKNRVSVLHTKFFEEFKNLIHPPKYVISVDVMDINTRLHLVQAPIWILGLLFSQIENIDEIQIGYVMNDDAISYIDDIKKAYNSYKTLSDNLIPISFPLRKTKKEEIVENLPEKYRELTITCEEPRIKGNPNAEILEYHACGYCVACKRQINTGIYNHFNEAFKKAEIENTMNNFLKHGKMIEQRKENNNLIFTLSLPDESQDEELLPCQPHQLELEFLEKIPSISPKLEKLL